MRRVQLHSNAPWEPEFGYARAVRVDDRIHVSGTTATDDDGELVGIGDAAAQTERTLRNIAWALEQLDSSLEDVVRTRMIVSRHEDWEAVARVHGEVFGAIRPASTLLIAELILPEMLVEIEADAVVGSGAARDG